MTVKRAASDSRKTKSIFLFLACSLLGSFVFFAPIIQNNKITIPLEIILKAIQTTLPWFGNIFALAVLTIGGILPFYDKTWHKDRITLVLSCLKLLGIGAGFMAYFRIGPEWLMREDLLPNLWTNVVVPVSIIVPLGTIFLTFILCYGLVEFIGVLMRPIMRPVWKLPGRAAVDAVTSFVGSFAIAMFMTNRLYREGKYNEKEAAIILTGFSSVSLPFMFIVADILKLMDIWIPFIVTSLIVTFLVTAITARIYPIRSINNDYFQGSGKPEQRPDRNIFASAFSEALLAARDAGPVYKNIWITLKDGMAMNFRLISIIISVGLISFVLVKTTPVFDYIGYVFYPFTYLIQVPDPVLAAKTTAVAGAEMFIPSLILAGTEGVSVITKFVVGVLSISLILFFSGTIPCILATDVRLGIKNLLIVMVERAILSLLIAGAVAHLIF